MLRRAALLPAWLSPGAWAVVCAVGAPGCGWILDLEDPHAALADAPVARDPLAIVARSPEGTAEPGAPIHVRFSAPLATGSLTSTALRVHLGDAAVAGELSYDDGAQSAVFRPAAPLALATTYRVTVDKAVRGAQGEALVESAEWTFAVRDGTWQPIEPVWQSPAAYGRAFAARVDMSPRGHAVASWRFEQGTPRSSPSATASVAGPGTPWSGPAPLELGPADIPSIGADIDDAGRATLLWPFAGTLWASYYRPQTGWSTEPAKVDGPMWGAHHGTVVAGAGDGEMVGVWLHRADTSNPPADLRVGRVTVAGAWTLAPTPLDTLAETAALPAVATAAGVAVVTWLQREEDRTRLWASSSTAAAAWIPPLQLSTSRWGDVRTSMLAMAPDGHAVAIWLQDAFDVRPFVDRFDPVTGWARAPFELVPDPNSVPKGDSSNALIGIDDRHGAMAMWQQAPAGDLLYRRLDPVTSTWSTTALVADLDAMAVPEPALVVDGRGNALAAWTQGDGVWTRRFAGGAWGPPQRASAERAIAPGEPHLAVDGSGCAVLIWLEDVAHRRVVMARRFR